MGAKFPLKYVVLALCAILVQVAAQIVAAGAGTLVLSICGIVEIGNVTAAAVYPLVTLAGLWALCRTMGGSMAEFRMPKPKLDGIWCAAAVLMPLIVCGIYFLLPGQFVADPERMGTGLIISSTILYTGFAAGIAEEAVFRGVIMTAIENRWGRAAAVLVPSVLFGALHLMNGPMTLASKSLVIAAGTMVGILFSLTAVVSGNVWNGALMHGVWNAVITGVLHIGPGTDPWALFSYVPESTSIWLTGGDFGVEASIVSVGVYVLFIVLAVIILRRKQQEI